MKLLPTEQEEISIRMKILSQYFQTDIGLSAPSSAYIFVYIIIGFLLVCDLQRIFFNFNCNFSCIIF